MGNASDVQHAGVKNLQVLACLLHVRRCITEKDQGSVAVKEWINPPQSVINRPVKLNKPLPTHSTDV